MFNKWFFDILIDKHISRKCSAVACNICWFPDASFTVHPTIHSSIDPIHPSIHPFIHICYTCNMYIYIYTVHINEFTYKSNSPHSSQHASTFHSCRFVPRSCPKHFPLPVLDLGHVHQAIRCGAILQGHRHEGAEGRSACHHAGEPLLTSLDLGKSWKIMENPETTMALFAETHEALFASELPNQKVNLHENSAKFVKICQG